MPGRSRRNASPVAGRANGSSTQSGSSTASGSNAAKAAAVAPPRSDKASGGVLGWFRSAGEWVGDKYDQITETVGDFVQDTGQAVGEMYDAWTSTDFSLEDGVLAMDTDLNEVMDLLPESAQKALSLDASGDNRVRVELDTDTKALTIRAPDLRIAGVQQQGLTTGPATLQGVVITVTNHGGGIPLLDGSFSFLGYEDKADNVAVDIDVQRVVASDVAFEGADGPVRVDQLELGGFKVNAASQGGIPFGDKGTTTASFDVAGAVLRGVSANGASASEVTAEQVGGGLHGSAETAFLEAGRVSVADMAQDGNRLGSAEVRGVRADIRNQGGGMPLLDETPDALQSHVTVSSGSMRDFDSAQADVASAGFSDLTVFHDSVNGRTELDAGGLQASGLDTATLDAAAADLDDLSLDLSRSESGLDLNAVLGGATFEGVEGQGVRADRVTASDLAAKGAFGSADQGMRGSATVGAVGASGLKAGGASVRDVRATALGADFAKDGSDLTAQAGLGGFEATGVTAAGASVDRVSGAALRGSVDKTADGTLIDAGVGNLGAHGVRHGDTSAASVSVGDATFTQGNDGLRADVGELSATDLRKGDAHRVGQVEGRDLSFEKGDRITGRAGSLSASDVRSGELSASRLSASSAWVDHGEDTRFGADDLGLRDFSARNIEVASAKASGASARIGDDGMEGSVARADVDDALVGGRVFVDSASVTDVTAGQQDDRRTVRLSRAAVQGVTDRVSGASAGSASVHGVDFENDGALADARIDRVEGTDLSGAGAEADRVTVDGTHLQVAGDETRADIDALQVDRARYGDAYSLESARATGVSALAGPDAQKVGVGDLTAQGIGVDTGGTEAHVGRVSARALSADRRGDAVSGSVGGLSASDASFALAPGGGKENKGAGLDTAALASSLGARVDHADLSLSAPMRAGEYKSGVGLEVDEGTQLDARVRVRDNKLTEGTEARFSNPVGGPLWTTARGAYVDDKGRLKADVGGFFDINLTGGVNDTVGADGKKIASLSDIGAGVAASKGGQKAASGGKPGIDQAFDFSGHRAEGRIGLSAGTIDAGAAKVDLAEGQAGDNVVDVKSVGGQELVVSFARFLTSALSLDVGGQSVDAGAASLEGARVAVDQGGADQGAVTGTVGGVTVEDVRFGKR